MIFAIMNNVWDFLSGKKTAIGGTAQSIISWAFLAGKIDKDTAIFLQTIITIWLGVGISHKIQKAKK